MTRFFSFSFIVMFILLFGLQVTSTSCTKEELIHDTVTNTVHDTIIKIQHDTVSKDTAITLQLLTANYWKYQELIGVEGNTNIRYVRGSAGNTADYNNHYIVLNSDFTGGFYDPFYNYMNTLTWHFADPSNTKIVMTINFPTGAVTQTWDHIFYKNKSIIYDQAWTQNGTNAHYQIVMVPR